MWIRHRKLKDCQFLYSSTTLIQYWCTCARYASTNNRWWKNYALVVHPCVCHPFSSFNTCFARHDIFILSYWRDLNEYWQQIYSCESKGFLRKWASHVGWHWHASVCNRVCRQYQTIFGPTWQDRYDKLCQCLDDWTNSQQRSARSFLGFLTGISLHTPVVLVGDLATCRKLAWNWRGKVSNDCIKEVMKLWIAFSYSGLECRTSDIFIVGGGHRPITLPSCQHSNKAIMPKLIILHSWNRKVCRSMVISTVLMCFNPWAPHWELPFPDHHFRWEKCCCNVSMWVCCYKHINVPYQKRV